jgi:L-threonylcarbamoyladenylate synthase
MSASAIDQAVRILRAGGLVAFPTETVYGLGADAANEQAVRRIFEVKGRPADHPVIVHLAGAEQLPRWAREVPPAAQRLAERFWPGPLTLILNRAPSVLDVVTGCQDTVGLRVPAHPVAHALLELFGGGIAGPSANRFGRISPTTAHHVRDELGERVDLVLDGGSCTVGIESTIVDLSSGKAVVLRPGQIGASDLEAALGGPVSLPAAGSPRASGTLASHYAPKSPLLVVAPRDLEAAVRVHAARGPVAVLAVRARPAHTPAKVWEVAPSAAEDYARMLYAGLRDLDRTECALLVVEAPPTGPQWVAVHDRLRRAAAGSVAQGADDTP